MSNGVAVEKDAGDKKTSNLSTGLCEVGQGTGGNLLLIGTSTCDQANPV